MWTMQFLILIGASTQRFDAERSDGVYPRNLAVIVGHPIRFLCGTASDKEVVIWKVKKIGKLNEELISNGLYVTTIYLAANFTIGQSRTGNSQLTKDRAALDDAGTYKCIRTSRNELVIGIGTAQLIVFGFKPECYSNPAVIQEGDCLHILCIVYYSGILNPVIECSEVDGLDSKSLTNFSGSGNVTVFNKCVSSRDNGKNVSCTIYFEPLSSIDYRSDAQKADNAPEITHEWIHQLNVEFQPKSLVIDPIKDVFMNGEMIRCISDGNPIPLYTWRVIGSNVIVSFNSTLVVNEKTMQGRSYECTATNTRGSLSTSITIRVSESSFNHDSSMIRGVTIIVGVFCAALFLIVIAVTVKHMAGTCRPIIHNLSVRTEENPAPNVATEYEVSNDVDQQDETVLQDDIDLNAKECDLSPYNPLSAPETSSTYAQLGNRSAITLVPPVYESLEDYELIPEVSNIEEQQMYAAHKDANAKLDPAKAFYANMDQIRTADDYINAGHIFSEEE